MSGGANSMGRFRARDELKGFGRRRRSGSALRWIAAFAALGGIVWALPHLPFLNHRHVQPTNAQAGQWVTKTLSVTPDPQPAVMPSSPAAAKAPAMKSPSGPVASTTKATIPIKLIQEPASAKPKAVASPKGAAALQSAGTPVASEGVAHTPATPSVANASPNAPAPTKADTGTSPNAAPVFTTVAAQSKPAGQIKNAALQWQSYHVHSGETLSGLFHRAGLPAQAWIHILKLGHSVEPLRRLSPHHVLKLGTGLQGHLLALTYQINSTHTLKISRPSASSDWQAEVHAAPVTVLVNRVSAVVHHSLLLAAHRAGLTFRQAAQLADIFHWRVNLRRDIQPGDRIVAVYNEREVHGHALAPGRIVAAKLVTGSHTWQAFWFDPKGASGGYYTARGHSLKAGILRAPIHYQYISSKFSLHRFDPYLHKWLPHYGVDYAADIGTPIEAAANGRVVYRARMRGYGRLVIIKSFGRWQTYYAHMHRFARGIHVGSHVHQGQIIGYVGESGWATGPHLHFGIRHGNHWVNPLKAKLPTAHAVPVRYKQKFEHRVHELLADIKAPNGKLGIAQHTTRSHAVSESG